MMVKRSLVVTMKQSLVDDYDDDDYDETEDDEENGMERKKRGLRYGGYRQLVKNGNTYSRQKFGNRFGRIRQRFRPFRPVMRVPTAPVFNPYQPQRHHSFSTNIPQTDNTENIQDEENTDAATEDDNNELDTEDEEPEEDSYDGEEESDSYYEAEDDYEDDDYDETEDNEENGMERKKRGLRYGRYRQLVKNGNTYSRLKTGNRFGRIRQRFRPFRPVMRVPTAPVFNPYQPQRHHSFSTSIPQTDNTENIQDEENTDAATEDVNDELDTEDEESEEDSYDGEEESDSYYEAEDDYEDDDYDETEDNEENGMERKKRGLRNGRYQQLVKNGNTYSRLKTGNRFGRIRQRFRPFRPVMRVPTAPVFNPYQPQRHHSFSTSIPQTDNTENIQDEENTDAATEDDNNELDTEDEEPEEDSYDGEEESDSYYEAEDDYEDDDYDETEDDEENGMERKKRGLRYGRYRQLVKNGNTYSRLKTGNRFGRIRQRFRPFRPVMRVPTAPVFNPYQPQRHHSFSTSIPQTDNTENIQDEENTDAATEDDNNELDTEDEKPEEDSYDGEEESDSYYEAENDYEDNDYNEVENDGIERKKRGIRNYENDNFAIDELDDKQFYEKEGEGSIVDLARSYQHIAKNPIDVKKLLDGHMNGRKWAKRQVEDMKETRDLILDLKKTRFNGLRSPSEVVRTIKKVKRNASSRFINDLLYHYYTKGDEILLALEMV